MKINPEIKLRKGGKFYRAEIHIGGYCFSGEPNLKPQLAIISAWDKIFAEIKDPESRLEGDLFYQLRDGWE